MNQTKNCQLLNQSGPNRVPRANCDSQRDFCDPLNNFTDSGGYWVRRMRQLPRAPHFSGNPLNFRGPPRK